MIPPETTAPVTSNLEITEDQEVSELDVSVRIVHEDATELIVELTAKATAAAGGPAAKAEALLQR